MSRSQSMGGNKDTYYPNKMNKDSTELLYVPALMRFPH